MHPKLLDGISAYFVMWCIAAVVCILVGVRLAARAGYPAACRALLGNDPGTAEGWKSDIARAAEKLIPDEPLAGPIELIVHFFLPRPKAHFRANGELKPKATTRHVGRPDLANLEKAVMDALTSLQVWRDDSQVFRKTASKGYAGGTQKPGCEIIVYER